MALNHTHHAMTKLALVVLVIHSITIVLVYSTDCSPLGWLTVLRPFYTNLCKFSQESLYVQVYKLVLNLFLLLWLIHLPMEKYTYQY